MQIRSVVFESIEGASRMIPGSDDDDIGGAHFPQQLDGELGVLTGIPGFGLQPDRRARHPAAFQNAAIGIAVPLAGTDHERRGSGLKQFGGVFGAFRQASAENDHHLSLNRATVDREHLLGETPQERDQEQGHAEKNAADF